jgi:hypothetical protein
MRLELPPGVELPDPNQWPTEQHLREIEGG